MVSRSLDHLSERFRPLAFELLARCIEADIHVLIVCTRRDWEDHQKNLANGTSWTKVSKHLDGLLYRQAPTGSDAIDICPFLIWQLHGLDKLQWSADDPVWTKLGRIGEGLGLRWGGRWSKPDLGHLEFVERR